MGDEPFSAVIRLVNRNFMKEQLESNALTKYAAGLMEGDELRILEEWLKENPQYLNTHALIQQQVRAMSTEFQFALND